MKDTTNKQDQRNKAAYIAARDAIVAKLGKNAPTEDYLDVVMLLAHHLLTQGGALDHLLATQNADVFGQQLKMLVDESQKNISSGTYCGVMM